MTDPQLADFLQLGMTKALQVQRQPGFPKPVWPGGPRCKRHVRSEVLAWALEQRDRPPESAPSPAKALAAPDAAPGASAPRKRRVQAAAVPIETT